MSTNNTIAEFPRTASQAKTITLDEVTQTVSHWRANKKTRSEEMPDEIWQDILLLKNKFSETTICGALGIVKMQLLRKIDEKKPQVTILPKASQLSKIDFCEVKQIPASAPPPLYTPNKIPATNTLIVEFCRADGRIMKIHTTTDSFAELMKSFFSEA
jgi:hypothetical protein